MWQGASLASLFVLGLGLVVKPLTFTALLCGVAYALLSLGSYQLLVRFLLRGSRTRIAGPALVLLIKLLVIYFVVTTLARRELWFVVQFVSAVVVCFLAAGAGGALAADVQDRASPPQQPSEEKEQRQ